MLAATYFWTNMSRVLLFWAAFILTRPLGATVGDFLDKPIEHGGLALTAAPAVTTAFLSSLVEAVEALTTLLAVTFVRGCRRGSAGLGCVVVGPVWYCP